MQSCIRACLSFFTAIVSFHPTAYTVTEGEDGFAVLTLERSGRISDISKVSITTLSGLAEGKNEI